MAGIDVSIDELEEYTSKLIRVPLGGMFRFRCTRCGRCCSGGPNVVLTIFDVVRMARFLRVSWRNFLRGYVKIVVADVYPFMLLRGDERNRCFFLAEKHDGTKLCVIYPARPMRCRLYPILVEDFSVKHVFVDPKSPGVGQGRLRPLPRRLIEQYVWERKEHYQRLHKLIVNEGLPPLRALYRALEDAWAEAEKGAQWADLDWLESLGSV
ncbi:YkgJ family cysteine cluster protein [Hyperthermus butylicus]|uniref:Fe-S oxidoreductase n=1 Tax=Hyperthermus butylicus (strain DSM 5456 / JCM 9403 / PLM1-5) TaxID=415426 RepID=A2BIX5_HYPBU|nr:YkgJ family cysteine cluster protein [Hyperthermus butylicus]ABM79936.1 putative Fe-S oxidoreductase [Hyperthermus butylicus DSM 5456]